MPPWTHWRGPGQAWRVQAPWSEPLLGQTGLQLEHWLAGGLATVVKQGQHRTVYRVDLPPAPVYIKHYHPPRWWGWLLGWWPGAADREQSRAAALVARGIPTAVPLAVGRMRAWRRASERYLVTAAIADAMALDHYLTEQLPRLPAPRQAQIRRQLVVGLAQFCARIHSAGIDHDDLHLGNLLLRQRDGIPASDERGQPFLFLIDVPGIGLGRPLGWRRTRASLVMLLSGSRGVTSATERWRFWHAYWAARTELAPGDQRRALEQIEHQSWHYARRLLRSRDKRCWRENRDFRRVRLPQGFGHAVSRVSAAELEALAADPATLLAQGWSQPLKLSHTSQVVCAAWRLQPGDALVVVKHARGRSALKRWLAALVPRLAGRAWKTGHALLARGIDTPRPLALVLPREFWARGEYYLVSEFLTGAQNLHEWLWSFANQPAAERHRNADQMAEALGRLVGRLHHWRLVHRDLKGANLALVPCGDAFRAYLLDIESVREARWRYRPRQLDDLVRLGVSLAAHPWVSPRSVLRFLRQYAVPLRLSKCQQRRLRRTTARRVAREVAKRRRTGRPLW